MIAQVPEEIGFPFRAAQHLEQSLDSIAVVETMRFRTKNDNGERRLGTIRAPAFALNRAEERRLGKDGVV